VNFYAQVDHDKTVHPTNLLFLSFMMVPSHGRYIISVVDTASLTNQWIIPQSGMRYSHNHSCVHIKLERCLRKTICFLQFVFMSPHTIILLGHSMLQNSSIGNIC